MNLRPLKEPKNKNIRIEDWAGNVLFEGPYNDKQVLKVMRKNKAPNEDIFVYWEDEKIDLNVYEFIDF